ncbi:SAM-dependent methyltransferase [Collibacillus ludicampi]|jgi:phospholipid N-methyltransferase|uniref:SAM-dependent methyltransferase n=1 Tax=Collibacillus ludicampi TaxID=2771369 RepID=A0AAV4LAX3_9BACL|nr:methyltransferase domain-containing protein [Collibacillus ludicampi]GIM44945.1 SAM-dependent methyltransferase [Collibacillus ludicampi]
MFRIQAELLNRLSFFNKFFHSPRTIGSITPSSIFLAKEMVKCVDWKNTDVVVELGAGTGIFTRQIHGLKKPDCSVVIFELDHQMRRRLQEQYPSFHYYADAQYMSRALEEFGIPQVDCIVSGLPFTTFHKGLRDKILDGVIHSLKPGGWFITFQYSLHMKKELIQRFKKVDISFVPFNVPPAFVYRCQKE